MSYLSGLANDTNFPKTYTKPLCYCASLPACMAEGGGVTIHNTMQRQAHKKNSNDVNYIAQLNAFWAKQEEDSIPPLAKTLYLTLMHLWNTNFWREEFPMYYEHILHLTGITNNQTYYKYLSILESAGYITWTKGKNNYTASKVKIHLLYDKTEEQRESTPKSTAHIYKTEKTEQTKNTYTKECINEHNPLVQWLIKEDYFNCLSMQGVLTKEQCTKIRSEYADEDIIIALTDMENKDLSKYKSMYLTIRKFIDTITQ